MVRLEDEIVGFFLGSDVGLVGMWWYYRFYVRRHIGLDAALSGLDDDSVKTIFTYAHDQKTLKTRPTWSRHMEFRG